MKQEKKNQFCFFNHATLILEIKCHAKWQVNAFYFKKTKMKSCGIAQHSFIKVEFHQICDLSQYFN